MTTIIEKGYHVTPEQVEHMAREVAKGYDGTTTYLRCLVVAAQESRKRGVRAVDEAHAMFWPAVLRGVGEGPDQRRKSTFAKTAASTLRGYVKRGGRLADLDVSTVTKGTLRAWGRPSEPGDRVARSAARAVDMLLRAIRRMMKRDPAAARQLVSEAQEALQAEVPAGTRKGRGESRAAVH